MALLIHIAGDSDLGIARGGLHPYERRRIQKGRLNELEELSDPEQIARRLLEMNYDVAVEEKRRGVDVNPDQEQSTPMEKAFQGLKELKKQGLCRFSSSARQTAREEQNALHGCSRGS